MSWQGNEPPGTWSAPPLKPPAKTRRPDWFAEHSSLLAGLLALLAGVAPLLFFAASLFPSQAQALHQETVLLESPAPQASPQVRVERAVPVDPQVGSQALEQLPDGQKIECTFRGMRPRFSDLPTYPSPGDTYKVTEGPGTLWIWATPLGFTHPAWVDP